MNLDNFKRSSRVFAAGLCGAALLTFTALDQKAQAQDQPDEPQGEKAQQEPETDTADAENKERQTNNQIDLSDASFEAEVVRTVGNSALIVQADEMEFLLPSSVVNLATKEQEGANLDKEVEVEPVAVSQSTVGSDSTAASDTEVADTSDTQVVTVETDKSVLSNGNFKAGDKVRVSFATTNAELVALENKVLTVRTPDSLMQLPAEALSDEAMSKVSFTANIDGETRIMTLQEALDDARKLTVSQEWPKQLPKDAEVGVIVANNSGRLLLATVSNDKIELIQVPQSMQAGEAVSLKASDAGDIAVSPLDGAAGMIAFQKTEFKGTLLSQNSDFIVLESGEHHLVLPAGLQMTEAAQDEDKSVNEDTDRQVTVILPAGQAEMVAQHEDNVVLETKHGMAQMPLALLNQDGDATPGVDVSSVDEDKTVTND